MSPGICPGIPQKLFLLRKLEKTVHTYRLYDLTVGPLSLLIVIISGFSFSENFVLL